MEQRKSKEILFPLARDTRGSRRTALRVMHRKSSGIVMVYEQDATAAEAGARTLVFESPTSRAQVERFPAEWHRLSDDELAALRKAAS